MSKIYEGYELLKAIKDKEIKQGAKIKVSNNLSKLIFDGYTLRWENSLEIAWVDNFTNENITFELIEDEVDIDNIEELLKIEEYEVDKTDTVINRNKINELVQAVKQLNKRTRKEKE